MAIGLSLATGAVWSERSEGHEQPARVVEDPLPKGHPPWPSSPRACQTTPPRNRHAARVWKSLRLLCPISDLIRQPAGTSADAL